MDHLNEAIKVRKYKKLKDSIHDVVTNLPEDEWLTLPQLSQKLKEHNISVPSIVLKKLLDDWKEKKSKIFNRTDFSWLSYDEKNGKISHTTKHYARLGKSRKKQIEEEKKKNAEALKKKKEELIEKSSKRAKDEKLNCPIPTEVIVDVFQNLDIDDIINVKKLIHDSIESKELEDLYEPAWDYMLKKATDPIKNGGLGLSLNKSTYKEHEPDPKWVIAEDKDLDRDVPVLYYKYGKGTIDSITDETIVIDFDKVTPNKRLKRNSTIANKSLRVDKDYVKEPVKKKGYEIAYLKDLSTNDIVHHKIRGKGEISSVFSVDDYIKVKFGEKIVKIPNDEFLKDQNIIIKTSDKKPKTTYSYGGYSNTSDVDTGDWVKVNNMNELKVGMKILYAGSKIGGEITEITPTMMKVYNQYNNYVNFNHDYFIRSMGVWKKKEKPTDNEWRKVTVFKSLTKGDQIKIDGNPPKVRKFIRYYTTTMQHGSDILYTEKPDGTEEQFELKDIENKTYKNVGSKQLSIFNQEDRELNKFSRTINVKEPEEKISDYVKVEDITELKVGDPVYHTSNGFGKIDSMSRGFIHVKHGINKTTMYQGKMCINNGTLLKKKSSKVASFDKFEEDEPESTDYKSTNIGFKKEEQFNTKIEDEKDIKIGMVVKYYDNIGKVDEISNGRIEILYKNGTSLNTDISKVLKNGLYKKTDVPKTQQNSEWVKVTDPSQIKKGMEVKYKRTIYKVTSISNKNQNKPYITIKSIGTGSTMSWSVEGYIRDGIYIRNQETLQKNYPDDKRKPSKDELKVGDEVFLTVHNTKATIEAIKNNSIQVKLEKERKIGGKSIPSITMNIDKAINNGLILIDDKPKENKPKDTLFEDAGDIWFRCQKTYKDIEKGKYYELFDITDENKLVIRFSRKVNNVDKWYKLTINENKFREIFDVKTKTKNPPISSQVKKDPVPPKTPENIPEVFTDKNQLKLGNEVIFRGKVYRIMNMIGNNLNLRDVHTNANTAINLKKALEEGALGNPKFKAKNPRSPGTSIKESRPSISRQSVTNYMNVIGSLQHDPKLVKNVTKKVTENVLKSGHLKQAEYYTIVNTLSSILTKVKRLKDKTQAKNIEELLKYIKSNRPSFRGRI